MIYYCLCPMSDYIHYVHTCFQAAKGVRVTSHDINLLFTVNIQSQHQMSRIRFLSWWCHQMEAFSALLALCAGNSPMTGDFPSQRPVTRSFDVFCELRLNKPLSKQSWGWWFEPLSLSLWRHCNISNAYASAFLRTEGHLSKYVQYRYSHY